MKKTIMLVATAIALSFTASSAFAEGNAKKGKKVFKKCKACHAVGEDAKNKIGPVLNGLVGRTAGTFEGFAYSEAMKKAGADGKKWTEEELDKFLTKPSGAVPGNKMAFGGIKKEKKRANLIAYLKTFTK